jgi:hypothetical protein
MKNITFFMEEFMKEFRKTRSPIQYSLYNII